MEGVVQELRVHDLDAVLAKEAVDLLDLLGRKVYLLEEFQDLAGLKSTGLLPGLEEFLDLIYLPKVALGLQGLLCSAVVGRSVPETLSLSKRNISDKEQRSTSALREGNPLLGLRNLYRVFQESRTAARRRTTLAVLGDAPEAAALASLLNAGSSANGAEVLLSVSGRPDGRVKVSFSGQGVEDEDEATISEVTEEAVRAEIAPRLVSVLEEDYLVPLARGYALFRRAACEEIVRKNARQNAVIGALPIPGADMPAITANQGRMVLHIAAAFGEELTMERARELGGVLAAGFGLRALSRQLLKLVPVAGWAASGAIGYAGTVAMGRAAILYFERGKVEPGPAEKSEILRRAQEEAKAFVARVRRR